MKSKDTGCPARSRQDTGRVRPDCMYESSTAAHGEIGGWCRLADGGVSSPGGQGGIYSRHLPRRSTYKHVPHREKAPHLVVRRNARERRRVQAVNNAFVRLRRHIPYENRSKRLSKVRTLRIAIDYIAHMQEMIASYDRMHSLAGRRQGYTAAYVTAAPGAAAFLGSIAGEVTAGGVVAGAPMKENGVTVNGLMERVLYFKPNGRTDEEAALHTQTDFEWT